MTVDNDKTHDEPGEAGASGTGAPGPADEGADTQGPAAPAPEPLDGEAAGGEGDIPPDGAVSIEALLPDVGVTPGPGEGDGRGAPALPRATVGRVSDELKAVIEALVYASPDPLTEKTLVKVLESEPREDVLSCLDALRRDYAGEHGGLHLVEVAGGYQIVTRPEFSEWVRRLFHERKTQKLSVAALETLAVIAYKQPITAPEVAEIRDVNTTGTVATLLERRLIKIAGRKQVVGRPFLYATTREFLIRFGLKDLGDLPKMEDMADVLGFEPPTGLAEAGPSEALLPLDAGPDPDQTLDVPPGDDPLPEDEQG
jgi:segregation and condensation protein B